MKKSVAAAFVALAPAIVWLHARWQDIQHSFEPAMTGELAGLVGLTFMAVALILSARLKVLDRWLQGLDKVYGLHAHFGKISLALLLLHPLLLSRYAPSPFSYLEFLLFSGWLEKDIGSIALYLMVAGVVLALYVKLRYEIWKLLHKFMYAVFLLGAYHSLFISSQFTSVPAVRYYLLAISAIGGLAGLYSVAREFFAGRRAAVKGIRKVGRNVWEIEFGLKLDFEPGQFVFVLFEKKGMREWHPFSIISARGENIKIAVKEVGDFTRRIKEIRKGDIARIDGPYGGFCSGRFGEKQLWIAGGIGVAPFVSMASEARDVVMYYSVRREENLVYVEHLKKRVKLKTVVTNKEGRLTPERIAKEVEDLRERDILICGPPQMIERFEESFRKMGVRNVIYERFSIK